MPGEPVRAKECRPATCRDWRRRQHQTQDEVVLSGPLAAAWRRGWLSDVPTGKALYSCQVLFPAGPPRTRGFQTACPPDRFGSSMLSARELRKSRRFPCLYLLSTTNGVEPLPNIRDGILVKRLVQTIRYVADMRRCQYVVQRAEGVRRRQRLNVEYVDRRAGDALVRQHVDQRLLVDDRPARRIDQPGRWLHSLQLRVPD